MIWTCLLFTRLISLIVETFLASLVDAPNAYCKPHALPRSVAWDFKIRTCRAGRAHSIRCEKAAVVALGLALELRCIRSTTMAPTTRTDVAVVTSQSEVRRLLDLDTVPWYKRRNLRRLYFALIPAVLGVEMTSGYDGSIMNGLQAVKPWLDCQYLPLNTHS